MKTEKHCENSRERTGQTFEELHEWMDKPGEILGMDHRRVRHDLSYINEVKKLFEEKFGPEVVKEFLLHISEDYKDSADKWGKPCATPECKNRTWHKHKYCNACLRLRRK